MKAQESLAHTRYVLIVGALAIVGALYVASRLFGWPTS
jgi:hypothetical protein